MHQCNVGVPFEGLILEVTDDENEQKILHSKSTNRLNYYWNYILIVTLILEEIMSLQSEN